MTNSAKLTPFSVMKQKEDGRWQFHLMLGLVVGLFYPMIPTECGGMEYGFDRYVFCQRWLTIYRGWTCIAWQIRVLWFVVGRLVFIEPVEDTFDKIKEVQ